MTRAAIHWVGNAYWGPGEPGRVTIAWLMPVSAAEADYIRARGARAFEQLMLDHDIDPTNFNRASMLEPA